MKRQILVHDDESAPIKRYTRKLRELDIVRRNFEVSPLEIKEFADEMRKLIERQRVLRKGKKEYPQDSRLDHTDIFIVDYDLVKSMPDANWTSEMVAYLARCFSNCGLLIGLNLPPMREFDLTLRGNLSSFADLNIVSDQLRNRGLWGGVAEGFRPWYWPPLLSYLESFEQKVKEVKNHLNDAVCEVVGIKDIAGILPQSVIEFIGGKNPLRMTFRRFVTESTNALRRKDRNPDTETLSRIAASRISKWLERRVLPGQNFVVDAPHLVSRFPSLLNGDHSSLETWNTTATFGNYESLGLYDSMIEQFRFKKVHWFSRPVWCWRELAESVRVKEVREPWEKRPSDYRFCEDASKFYRKTLCKQFSADVDSPYDRRYVRRFPNVDYEPFTRLVA